MGHRQQSAGASIGEHAICCRGFPSQSGPAPLQIFTKEVWGFEIIRAEHSEDGIFAKYLLRAG
jgi:hypothetical protein